MGDGKRSERVADLIQREISDLLMRSTRVSVSDDCRTAKVYYSVVGSSEEREASVKGLESAKGFLRRELGKRVTLRYTPELLFQFDPSIEYAIHIEEVLRELRPAEGGESDEG